MSAKYNRVLAVLDDFFGDMSVPQERTKELLEELLEDLVTEIDNKIQMLEVDINDRANRD